MSNDNWTGSGYSADASSGGGGIYFRLKEKGQSARLRLVSSAYRFMDALPDGKPLKKAAWLAILKEMVNGAPHKRVVVFQAGPMVYGLIKDLAESDEWGDPTEFDITVTRTEQEGKYYTVLPHPKPLGPISKKEEQLVEEAGINLVDACSPRDKASDTAANGGDESYDPFSDH